MSVIFDNRRRQGDYEQGAPGRPAARDRQPRSVPFPPSQRREDEDRGPLLGFAYDRIEGVVHLTLAFTIVGGAAVILSSALFSPGAPLGGAVEKPAQVAQASVASAIAPAVKESAPAPAAPVEKVERAPAPAASPAAPAPAAASAAPAADPFLDARPMSEVAAAPAPLATAPHPLAPPSADMREKLVAQEEAPPPPEASAYKAAAAPSAVEPREEAPAAPAIAGKPAAEPKASAEGARMAKCFLKLSGRVENSGACRVNHTGDAVIFNLPGKPLELAHDHGRVWTATLGGRSLGKVYKNKGAPCWGAKGFYACENG